ncbi:universal stress protein [Thioalkalivibrio thiocyanoxidans]|uniref:universal stress protein n=1 Tax=Thioalkalivibrio thiocyanoxidans TaxID=152475 RepID=UPI0003611B42|nr:universal stress protein [Thioalkalivibrio thiocyanoxidans]
MELKTMLVPVDGSDNAWRAVEVAADLAAKYQARVVLLSVLLQGEEVPPHIRKLSDLPDPDDPPVALGGAAVAGAVPPKVLHDIAKKLTEKASEYFTERGVTDIERHVQDGSPARVILQQAEYHHADMIVMGARGLGNLKGLVSGSVSNKVQQLARCIVVTVN